MNVIGLHGLTGVGKDTLADMLASQCGYTKMAFADPLYEEVGWAFDVSPDSLRSREWKNNPQPDLALSRYHGDRAFLKVLVGGDSDKRQFRTSRWVVQKYGTEFRRTQNHWYWVNQFRNRLLAVRHRNVVVPDVRFANEALFLWEIGVCQAFHVRPQIIFEITRAGSSIGDHVSDHRIPGWMISQTIHNIDDDPYAMLATLRPLLGRHF